MFAIPYELQIPRKYAGSTSGLVAQYVLCTDFSSLTVRLMAGQVWKAGYRQYLFYAAS
jgi:hypothetical protein